MKVSDMSTDEFKLLIKGAIKEEIGELLEVKRRIFELETLQALKEVEEGNIKSYETVESMLDSIKDNEV